MKSLFLNHPIAAGNPGNKTIDLVFGHFTLFDVIFLVLQMFSQARVKHLGIRNDFTVILLFKGYNYGSISILSTL